jgi:HEAT repeat protein
MTSLDFLIIAAGVQAGFLVALVVLIALTRLYWMRQRARTAGPKADLDQAWRAFLAGDAPSARLLPHLRRLPRHMALDTLIHYATRTPPEVWRRLTTAVANQSWVRAIRRWGRSRHWWRRLDAGRLLAAAGRSADAPLLLRLLADEHPAVVLAVIGALEQVQSPALLAAVLERLPRLAPAVQAYAAVSLQRVRGGLHVVVAKYLTGPRDRPGLAAYVELAGRLAAPELNAPITWLADHPDLEVRVAVARALGGHPGPESVEALRRLAEDKVWQVRAQAVQSLGKINAPTLDVFQQALRDAAWWVRLRGALSLARAGAAGRDALLAAETGSDAFARDMARLVLGLPPAALAEYQR